MRITPRPLAPITIRQMIVRRLLASFWDLTFSEFSVAPRGERRAESKSSSTVWSEGIVKLFSAKEGEVKKQNEKRGRRRNNRDEQRKFFVCVFINGLYFHYSTHW